MVWQILANEKSWGYSMVNKPDKKSNQTARRVKGLTGTNLTDFDSWATPDEGAIPSNKRTEYKNRKRGIELYLAGESASVIKNNCGLGIKQIYRLLTERCLEVHKDGQIFGWRALVPNFHIKPYKRKIKIKVNVFGGGASGAMQTVLDLNPDLRKAFEKKILPSKKDNELGPVRRPRQTHCNWFLEELRKRGYEIRNEWPFNTENNGYVSICRYIDKVLEANPKKAAVATGGPETAKKLETGDGVDRPVKEIYDRIEMDAHKLDGRFCVMLPLPSGDYNTKIVHRLWVIVILEVVSRAVLGYYFSMRKEVSKEDVLRTIKKSLKTWHRRKLAFSDEIVYLKDAGFPSSRSSNFVGACWKVTSVDGALAETCITVKNVLKNVVGSELIEPNGIGSFSVRRSKDDRPFIEAFFKNLASRGFQKMSNTTGGKSSDKKGRNPDAVAITSQFQYEYAEEILDVLIANYNATPHTGLGNRSPLQYLEFIEARGDMKFKYADPNSVEEILSFRKNCIVKGGYATGRRPFVNFEGAPYSNDLLSQRHDLVGKEISVCNHLEDDARIVKASTLNGQSLGILRAAPPWNKLPHSLALRKAINSCVYHRKFVIASGADAVETFLNFSEQQTNKKLPVHPAYLEARRILVKEAESQTGQSMIEVAEARLREDKNTTSNSTKKENEKTSNKSQLKESSKTLPARRLAASK